MQTRLYFGTLCGLAIGLVAILVWTMTFEPHGGLELSWFLFPIARLVLQAVYPHQSIPPLVWYGSALAQWVAIGVVGDLLRLLGRR